MRDVDAEIGQRFGELAGAELPAPPAHAVVSRGRQRRRRQRITACCLAAAVLAGAGSAAAYARSAVAGKPAPRPATRIKDQHPALLPPAGSGQLLLGEDVNGFVMARIGSTGHPVPVPGLRPVGGEYSLIATDPAGGWVVSYADDGSSDGATGQRVGLATVSASGFFRKFGPVLQAGELTSIAVRPGGAVVAIALTRVEMSRSPGPARIELIPLPGSNAAGRTWTLSSAASTMAESLSWAADGTRLTYIPGSDETGGGFAGTGAVTLNTTRSGSIAPAGSGWPQPATKAPGTCLLDAGAWAGDRYLALENCFGGTGEVLRAVNFKDGAPAGSAAQASAYYGCSTAVLDPGAGGQTLISGCGLDIGSPAGVSVLPGNLNGAAWAG